MKDNKYIVLYLQKGKLYSKENELDMQLYTLVWMNLMIHCLVKEVKHQ